MKFSFFDPRRLEFNSLFYLIAIVVVYFVLIASRVFAHNTYANAALQDLFGLLDGAYRVHSGQLIHQDFSTIIGLVNYCLPAIFMSFGAEPVASLHYSEALLVFVALLIFLYIQRTRLDNFVSLLLGVWIPVVLLARMAFGDRPYNVTEAMWYNRHCVVYLTLLLLLFIPPSKPTPRYFVIDGILYGIICAFLFYSKITFGIVAIGFFPLLLIRKSAPVGQNCVVVFVFALVFLLIAFIVEFIYGIRFAWWRDLHMALLSSQQNPIHHSVDVLFANLPELAATIFIPAYILLRQNKLDFSMLMFGIFVTMSSLLLVVYSQEVSGLFLPIAFSFVTLSVLRADLDYNDLWNHKRLQYLFVSTITGFVLLAEAYPLAVNIVIATYKSAHKSATRAPIVGDNRVLKDIIVDAPSNFDLAIIKNNSVENMSRLDVLSFARYTRPSNLYDNLIAGNMQII